MLQPNRFIVKVGTDTFGLHTFKDAKPDRYTTMICQLNCSGDWYTVRPPKPEEIAYFEKFGTPVQPGTALHLDPPSPAPSLTRNMVLPKRDNVGIPAPQTCATRSTPARPPSNPDTAGLSAAQRAWITRRAKSSGGSHAAV